MRKEGDEIHLTEEEASGGTKPHILRYMLAVSLALTIIAMTALWVVRSMNG
jgi:hypothetical protein